MIGSDSRSGLAMGDFISGPISGREERGAGKLTAHGGREKHACFSRNERLEFSMRLDLGVVLMDLRRIVSR